MLYCFCNVCLLCYVFLAITSLYTVYLQKKIEKFIFFYENESKAVPDNYDQSPTQNGVPRGGGVLLTPKNLPEMRECNLVRVSSWSERKNADTEIPTRPERKNPDIEIRRRLPSVKELAKQFSNNSTENDYEIRRFPSAKYQTVHSSTARSMSREFREGLKNVGKTMFINRNVLSNHEEDTDKLKNGRYGEENDDNIIRPKSQNGLIIWENQI